MEIKVYSGKIITLGASTSFTVNGSTVTTFSYIEMSDGQIIKSLRIGNSLEGELRLAFDNGETVELHVNKTYWNVLAIRHENGRVFSVKPESFGGSYFFSIIAIFMGLIGLAWLGGRNSGDFGLGVFWIILGILLFWICFKRISDHKQKNKHLEALNPIYID